MREFDAIGQRARSGCSSRCGLTRLMIGAALATTLGVTPTVLAGSGTTINIGAMKDNTLYESSIGSLSNGSGEYFFAGVTGTGSLRRGLLAFDIASVIPAGSVITNVELTLQMTRTVSGGNTVSLHRVLRDWGEGASNASGQEGGGAPAAPGDATWLHTFNPSGLWQTPGGDFSIFTSASGQVSGLGSYTWGSTNELMSDVQLWLNTPSSNFGWVIIGNEALAGTAKRFASRENLNTSFRPSLSVTYVPAPAGALTLGIGVFAICSRRRRRQC